MIGLAKIAADEDMQMEYNTIPMGLWGLGAGAYGINRALPLLDGMERVYHGTTKDNANAIRQQGIRADKAGTGNSSLNANLARRIGEENVKGKVYATRNLLNAATYGYQESGDLKNIGLVKGKIPYRDLQSGKLKRVPNPELRGLNRDEWVDTVKNEVLFAPPDNVLKQNYKELDAPNTLVIEGDLPTQYIKGSSNFKGQNLSGVADYIKNNPGRFSKGLGVAGLGVAGLGAGTALINHQLKKDD
jgi:hypothetical protein